MPNVKVIYDTSPEIITRAAHRGSLIEELRLLTLKQDGHGGLRDLDHQSVIPYVYGEYCCIIVYALQATLNWSEWTWLLLSSVLPFIVQGRTVTL
jgi:hypothetical protein